MKVKFFADLCKSSNILGVLFEDEELQTKCCKRMHTYYGCHNSGSKNTDCFIFPKFGEIIFSKARKETVTYYTCKLNSEIKIYSHKMNIMIVE